MCALPPCSDCSPVNSMPVSIAVDAVKSCRVRHSTFDTCCQLHHAFASCLLSHVESMIAISCMQKLVKQLIIQQQRFGSEVQSLWLQPHHLAHQAHHHPHLKEGAPQGSGRNSQVCISQSKTCNQTTWPSDSYDAHTRLTYYIRSHIVECAGGLLEEAIAPTDRHEW